MELRFHAETLLPTSFKACIYLRSFARVPLVVAGMDKRERANRSAAGDARRPSVCSRSEIRKARPFGDDLLRQFRRAARLRQNRRERRFRTDVRAMRGQFLATRN